MTAISQIVSNGQVTLIASSFGSAAHPAVLLIAGAMAPAIFWDDAACQTLAAKELHIIRFDSRDIGGSTHFPANAPESGIELPYVIDDLVEDAACVLAAHGHASAHIIGHSMGGSIAQLFAIKYPEKTRSLTAISSPILAQGDLSYAETDPSILEALWRDLMANPMYPDYERGAPEFMKIWQILNGDWPVDEATANNYTRSIYDTEEIAPAWNHTNIQNGLSDIMDQLSSLDLPMLFIHGEKDYLPANPTNTLMLSEHLQKASFYMLEGGGHMFFNRQVWDILTEQIWQHISNANE